MDKKEYLNISKAPDIADKKDRFIYRLLEIFPGALSLITLLGVVVFSWLLPAWVAIFIILFCFYYLCKILFLCLHQLASYFKMKKYLKTNWLEKIKTMERWKNIYHLISLPTYKEGPKIIEESLDALLASNYPKENLIIVLGVEERAGKVAADAGREIKRKYEKKFFRFELTIHPKDIPGEVAGKGSNASWAVKVAQREVVDKLKIPYEDVIVSNFDIDTKVYPDYFACLTWHYLTVKNPLRTSFQPIPVYNNNVWDAPAFSRVVATSNTFWQMIQQERVEKLTTYSTHAMPLLAWSEVGYPSNIVSDDSRIFWKAFLYYDGDYNAVPLYYPVSMDTVMAEDILKTAINQYKQQRRWAWGCNEIPYLIFGFMQNKKIPLRDKIKHLYNLLDGHWSWATAALLIFFLGWLPVTLGGKNFDITVLSYNLPHITGNIMTISLVGLLISSILSTLMLPRRPEDVARTKTITLLLQWALLPVTLTIFGTFPALDAQIRLMLGKYMGFWVTEKVRKDSRK